MERSPGRSGYALGTLLAFLIGATGPAMSFSGKGQELYDQARNILSQDPATQPSSQLEVAVKALLEAQRLTTGPDEESALKKWLGGAYANQAAALSKEGDHQNAIWKQKEAAKLDEGNFGVYHALGRYYENAGDYYNAGLSFAQALELGPEDMQINTGRWLVGAYMKLGETGDGRGYTYAVQEIDKLLVNHPDDARLYKEKAKSLQELGDEAGAAEALRAGQERGALDDDGIKMLGQISKAVTVKEKEGYVSENSLHFVVDFKQDAESQKWGNIVIETLEAAYSDLGQVFQHTPGGKVQVSVYFDADYQQVTDVAWSGGSQDGNRIDLRLSPEQGEEELVNKIYHEYSHYVTGQKANAQHVPGWLNEGFAMHQEKYPDYTRFYDALRDAMMKETGHVMTMEELTPNFGGLQGEAVTQAYGHGFDMVRYFIERFREGTLIQIIEDLGDGEDFDTVFRRQTSCTRADFEKEWQAWRRAEFEAGRASPTRLASSASGDEGLLYGMER